jgi:hypothetical protein
MSANLDCRPASLRIGDDALSEVGVVMTLRHWGFTIGTMAILLVGGAVGALAGVHMTGSKPIRAACMATDGTRGLSAPRHGVCPKGTRYRSFRRGPQGATGPIGPIGPTGPTGPASITTTHYSEHSMSVAAGGYQTLPMYCSSDSAAVAGGFNSSEGLILLGSGAFNGAGPTGGDLTRRGWVVSVRNPTEADLSGYAWISCIGPVPARFQ